MGQDGGALEFAGGGHRDFGGYHRVGEEVGLVGRDGEGRFYLEFVYLLEGGGVRD